jgi:hypothetical protein
MTLIHSHCEVSISVKLALESRFEFCYSELDVLHSSRVYNLRIKHDFECGFTTFTIDEYDEVIFGRLLTDLVIEIIDISCSDYECHQ